MKKINIGVVGLRFGATVIENLMVSEFVSLINLTSVFDLDKVKTETISKQYNVTGCKSFEEMLEDKSIDAVALYTPPTNRSELIEKIMLSGKHVITTKPFEADAVKAYEILKKSQQLKKVIHVNSPGVVENGLIKTIKECVKKYDLGIPVGARYDIWVNYNEKPDGSWYDDPEQCPVAPLFRLGIYIINDLISIFGAADKVSTLCSRLITKRPTVDNSQMSIQFKNGAIASIFGSFCVDDGQRYKGPVIINYERGTFYYNVMPENIVDTSELVLVRKDCPDGEAIIEKFNIDGPEKGAYLWDVFYNDIFTGKVANDEYVEMVVEGIKVLNAMKNADKQSGFAVVE